jgi:hypothetical protein
MKMIPQAQIKIAGIRSIHKTKRKTIEASLVSRSNDGASNGPQ